MVCDVSTICTMQRTKNPRTVSPQDLLGHFNRHGALVKLAALFLCKLPAILVAAGVPTFLVGRLLGKW
jgi:hypothetical protein